MSDKTNQDNSVFHPSPRDTPMGDLTHWPVVPQPATDSATTIHRDKAAGPANGRISGKREEWVVGGTWRRRAESSHCKNGIWTALLQRPDLYGLNQQQVSSLSGESITVCRKRQIPPPEKAGLVEEKEKLG